MLGLEELIGLELVSSDARVVGTVEGVGIDANNWRIAALRVGLRRGVGESTSSRRHLFSAEKVMMSTDSMGSVSDTVILNAPVSSVSRMIENNDGSLIPAGGLMGMRVICRNARKLGTVDNILIEPGENWSIRFLQVRLERDAVASLNMQQGILSAPLVPVPTANIQAMGDMIMLDITLEELRRQMASRATSPI